MSSSTLVFEKAATLNNEGVMALMEHNEMSAIGSLTNSIRLMKSALSKPIEDPAAFQKDDASSSSIELPAHLVELSPPPQEMQNYPFVDDDCELALFNHAISIPLAASSEEKHEPSDLDFHIYSAAVVFNLALAHQQLALRHKNDRRHRGGSVDYSSDGSVNSHQCLYNVNRNKAEKLYMVILKLLQDSACSQVRTGVMVKLAAIHNLHWIQYQKREEEIGTSVSGGMNEIPTLQQTLSRFVQGIRQQDPALARTFLENDAQIQGLLMNVLWLKEQQAPPKIAPAA
ncbi:hypothetical protein IV203_012521 [Nitzschia inconspicua]|uniref:Uncharacterized protein n=1 Tax=Nitzschia inconspicua TaxID=303405 RepID=A0A9K3KTX1_9STRA|nr:hypothetical protein IV203_012712 [Nitzschia inconspicua]KAG7349924.1 hypothetical protein IV203_012521 [Nitzschia inconspicua]